MPRTSKEEAQALQATLAARHAAHHVCSPETRLVVEGYPRSSNSFAVDMIAQSGRGHIAVSQIGHHTHDVANLQIAEAHGIPRLILIRPPEAAILSFHIYSGAPIGRCAAKYHAFYTGARALMDRRSAVAHFDEVTGAFGAVVRKLNAIGGFGIPDNQDWDAIREDALAAVRGRASEDAEEATRQVAAPTEARETMKAELRGQVQAFLAEHPRAERIYERVCKAAGL